MKRYLLLLLTAALLPAPTPAQVKIALEGQPYPLHSSVDAGADVNYELQWYRNGEPIPGCTTQVCTVPPALAMGDNVRFARKVIAQNCVENEGWSNEVVVTFKCGGGHGTRIWSDSENSLCWADRNVDAAGAFAANPDDYGRYYQWNRNRGWTSSEPATGWNSTGDEAATWTVVPLPCPIGWRLPSSTEFQDLDKAGGGTGANGNTTGSTWVAAGEKGNAVAGKFFGPNHQTCSLPSNMSDCLFFTALGCRNNNSGLLSNHGTNGYYWSSVQYSSTIGYSLTFTSSGGSNPANINTKTFGFSVRCVQ